MNTYVQLKTYQKYQGIEINNDHQDQDCTDGTVYFVVRAEIIDPIRKKKRQQDHQYGGQGSARRNQPPFFLNCRCMPVNKSDCKIKKGNDYDPSK